MSRPKMPHNNRMSSSSALKTNDIWSKTIGYDPYAASEQEAKKEDNSEHSASILLLARLSNLSGTESRGGCKKCGMLGHLTFQCRNQVAIPAQNRSNDSSDDDSSSANEDMPRDSSAPITQRRLSPPPPVAQQSPLHKRKRDDSSDDSSSSISGSDRHEKKRKHHKKKSSSKHKHKKHVKSKSHKKHKKE